MVTKTLCFKKGEEICVYHGEILTEQQLWARYGDAFAPYVITHDNGTIIDCARVRSFASMANQSTGNAVNAEHVSAGKKVIMYALKDIHDDEEIYVKYKAGPACPHVTLSHKTTSQKANLARLVNVKPSQGTVTK